eukprot:ANDGO_03185.mRNA.1 hypothetical protein
MSTLFPILEELALELRSEKRLVPEVAQKLSVLVGQKTLQDALTIVDQRKMQKQIGRTSGRVIYTCQGTQQKSYVTLSAGYCSCVSFLYESELRKQKTACKHIVACLIGDSVGMVETDVIDDRDLGEALWTAIQAPEDVAKPYASLGNAHPRP